MIDERLDVKGIQAEEVLEDDEFLLIEEDEPFEALSYSYSKEASSQSVELPSEELLAKNTKTWKIVIVDDEPSVHHATKLALKNFTFEGYPLEFVSAFSAQEGKRVLADLNGEAASILLDVVMETTHAGLELIEFVRTSLDNKQVRIILRTGQPGEAPPESVILNYDINDYQLKLDMTRQRLITSIVCALRSFRDIQTIEEQKHLLSETLVQLESSEQEVKKYTHNLEIIISERTSALQRANERLQRLAMLDGLTQVANRHFFDDYLQREWEQAVQNQSFLSLLLVDVDFFKRYNDYYGHLAGDDCLRMVAKALSQALGRSQDIVARYGGEEFAVILPNASSQGACRVAEDILKRVQGLKIPHPKSEASEYVSISAGLSCVIPQVSMHQTSLIEMADLALYQAKALGRNQYCLYTKGLDSLSDQSF